MTAPATWSTLQLAEFLGVVSSFQTESSAALGAIERAAEALNAEVAAIVLPGEVLVQVGYPAGAAPVADLDSIARGVGDQLRVPGVGVCHATGVPLDHPPEATLIVARSGPGGLNPEEASLLHGMARVTSMTMRMLRLLDEERALRERSERQAIENARLLATLTERRAQLERLAEEQAALRRVATLVARGVPPKDVFAAVAEEVSRLASTDAVHIHRYDSDDTAVAVAVSSKQVQMLQLGTRFPIGGHNVTTMVLRTGRAARIDDARHLTGGPAPIARRLAIHSAVGSPIVVDRRLWGVVIAVNTTDQPIPADTEGRISNFTELVATAISNAEARAQLAASRARVVAASDETRRRIERDLHDGAQQRLVTLALEVHAAHDIAPAERADLQDRLSRVQEGLVAVLDEVRELSRGLHPAILSEGGLGPAVRSLARRSALPVELDLPANDRLPEPMEVAAYYVVSEALANTTKHAGASFAEVKIEERGGALRVRVRDDGVGGADPSLGSGLVGLSDRVEALGGTITLSSPQGGGTSVMVDLPIENR
jgi:signal transduction histidine kinase